MRLRVDEIWDIEERELKRLNEIACILGKKAIESGDDLVSAKIEEEINQIYEEMRAIKQEVWERRKEYREDERVVALEDIMYTLMGEIEKLESRYEDARDEKQKIKLAGGILVFEFAINIIRHKIELLRTSHKVSNVNSSLREVFIWEKLCAMDIWIKLTESARNAEDESEKKGIMKAREIVDAY